MAEDMSAYIHKGLSEWWSEESEYLFRRIERWAACARGYNRLKSIRISRARMTMNEKPHDDLYWCGTLTNNYSIKRSKSPDETRRINCCGGTFNYQSNSHFNSTCLDTYRYDHSIYFKTIGDIKNSKKKLNNNINDNNLHNEVEDDEHKCQYYSCCNNNNSQDELNNPQVYNNNHSDLSLEVEFDNNDTQVNVVSPNGDVRWDYLYTNTGKKFNDTDIITSSYNNTWPIVDLAMITENLSLDLHRDLHQYNNDDNKNNNSSKVLSSSSIVDQQSSANNHDSSFTKMLNFRKPKRPIIVLDDNNITCRQSSVHLNCNNNTNSPVLSASYQHHHHHHHQSLDAK